MSKDTAQFITRDDLKTALDSLSLDLEVDTASVINDIGSIAGQAETLAAIVSPHIRGNADHIKDDLIKSMSDMISDLEAKLNTALLDKPTKTAKRKVVAKVFGAVATNAVEKALSKYCIAGDARYPVLVMGDPSAGKTYSTRKWGETHFDEFIEVACHQGIEARDLLGGHILCETAKGGMATKWIDGRVSRAVRLAASGKSVLLLLDEIYRCPSREANVLLGMLSAVTKADGSKWYRLCSDMPTVDKDGAMILETIECPVENLAIVGTTNVGGDFQIEDPDPAMKTRWHMVYVSITPDAFLSVVSATVSRLGFRVSLADEIQKFWKQMTILKADSFIDAVPTYRTIDRALECATSDSAEHINESFQDGIYSWVGINLDGKPEPQQVEQVKNTINNIWKK